MNLRIVSSMILFCVAAYNSCYALKFIAYGDSRDNLPVNQIQSALFEGENPALILHCGDVWGGTSQSSWKATFTGKTNLNGLLNAGKIGVS
ncbi:MAG: hypothetical protein PHC61_14335, partial [Chitinivibrionales bacterium]|nr:hypothetical protein [Chitinivibrionales bacterium]